MIALLLKHMSTRYLITRDWSGGWTGGTRGGVCVLLGIGSVVIIALVVRIRWHSVR